MKLLIFLDYKETHKLWKSFEAIQAKLREKGIKYGMLFPAKLHVQDGETDHFFTSPEDAAA